MEIDRGTVRLAGGRRRRRSPHDVAAAAFYAMVGKARRGLPWDGFRE